MLEYFAWAKSNFELFVFCKNKQPVWYTIPIDSVFKSSLSAFLSCFEDPNAIINNPRGYFNSAQSIWKSFAGRGQICAKASNTNPGWIPEFCSISDAMVCSPANETTNLRNADYLVKHTAISYACPGRPCNSNESCIPKPKNMLYAWRRVLQTRNEDFHR
ncbi:MAG: hypothetical protein R2778_04190 [Saprospiraceae bacterium]